MPTKDKPEAVPTASDRARFYQGATREVINRPGPSVADVDKRISSRTDLPYYPGSTAGSTKLDAAQSARSDLDRLHTRDIADTANTAAEYGDVATGRKKELPSYKKGGTVRETGPALLHKGEKVIPATKAMTGKAEMKSKSSAPKGMQLHSITTKRLKDGTYHHEHRFHDGEGNPHHVTHEYSSATNRDAGDHVAEQFEPAPPMGNGAGAMPDGQANAPETVPTGEQPNMQPEMAGV